MINDQELKYLQDKILEQKERLKELKAQYEAFDTNETVVTTEEIDLPINPKVKAVWDYLITKDSGVNSNELYPVINKYITKNKTGEKLTNSDTFMASIGSLLLKHPEAIKKDGALWYAIGNLVNLKKIKTIVQKPKVIKGKGRVHKKILYVELQIKDLTSKLHNLENYYKTKFN